MSCKRNSYEATELSDIAIAECQTQKAQARPVEKQLVAPTARTGTAAHAQIRPRHATATLCS